MIKMLSQALLVARPFIRAAGLFLNQRDRFMEMAEELSVISMKCFQRLLQWLVAFDGEPSALSVPSEV